MDLRPAGESDLSFVMATERLDGYDHLVGRWDAERHRAAMRDGRHAYLVAQEASGDVAGFVILRDWKSPEQVVCVKRAAVAEPGRGAGTRMMRALVHLVFSRSDAFRLWLGVFPENARARRAYEAAGFQAEGVARGSAFFGGRRRDELVMAVLRPEWQAARDAP